MTSTLDLPLRVPSVVPCKWVYLRSWEVYLQRDGSKAGYRSHGCAIWCVAFGKDFTGKNFAIVNERGLVPATLPAGASWEANQQAVEDHLLALGAEVVPKDEWPEGCVGDGHRPDRVPFRISDWDEADEAMRAIKSQHT